MNEIKSDLEEHGELITEDEKTKIKDTLASLEEAVKGEDVEDLRAKLNDFMQAASTLTNAKVKAEQAPKESTKADANVVDVEATEVKSA
jgi:molecular chaperone DnaK